MARTDGDGLRFDDRMSDLEALLWSLEAYEPAFCSTVTAVVALDRSPDPTAVAERVERLSRCLPRLRDRVIAGPVPTAPPRWEPDPDFDVERHLISIDAAQPMTLDDLLRAAEPMASAPLPRDRPLWQMLLVGCPGGRGGLIVRLHHTLTDGLGAVKLAAELFDFDRDPPPGGPPPPLPQRRRPSLLDRLWEDLAFEAELALDLARRLLAWSTPGIHDATIDPGPRSPSTLDLLQSLRTVAETAFGTGSPILSGRSADARFGALAFPLTEVRDAARRAGATVNDVFLAGVVGGLREYHAKRGYFPPWLRLGIPVSTRTASTEKDMRNQFAPVLVRVPLQLLDPIERVRLLHDLVIAAREQPLFDLLEQATGVLRRLPGAARLATVLLGSTDVMASNVPGSSVDMYLSGARVEQIVPLGPRGGTGLNLTLLSHVDTVNIGVNMDPVTVPDAGVLIDCLQSGFAEILS